MACGRGIDCLTSGAERANRLNPEVAVHFTSRASDASASYRQIDDTLNSFFRLGRPFDEDKLPQYRRLRKRRQAQDRSLPSDIEGDADFSSLPTALPRRSKVNRDTETDGFTDAASEPKHLTVDALSSRSTKLRPGRQLGRGCHLRAPSRRQVTSTGLFGTQNGLGFPATMLPQSANSSTGQTHTIRANTNRFASRICLHS